MEIISSAAIVIAALGWLFRLEAKCSMAEELSRKNEQKLNRIEVEVQDSRILIGRFEEIFTRIEKDIDEIKVILRGKEK